MTEILVYDGKGDVSVGIRDDKWVQDTTVKSPDFRVTPILYTHRLVKFC